MLHLKQVCDLRAYYDQMHVTTRDPVTGLKSSQAYPFRWYFYVRLADASRVRKIYPGLEVKPGQAFAKVYADYWEARKTLLPELHFQKIATFEGDFPPEDRFKYDHQIEFDEEVDLLYVDIETDDRNPVIDIGRDYILSFAARDKKGNHYFHRLAELSPGAEQELLEKFNALIKKYQIVAGWNLLGFDKPYLRARMERYEMRLANVGWFDMFKRAKHIYRSDSVIKSFSLENFCQFFLKRGKVKHEEKIYELWLNHPEKLQEYNAEDVNLCHDVDQVVNITDMMIRQAQWCNILPRKFSIYALIDSVIIQMSHQLRRPVPTNLNYFKFYREEQELSEDHFMGAEVLNPYTGFHRNVYVFDFKSLYPSIMMTCNIGYDVLCERPPEGDYCIPPGPATIPRERDGKVKEIYFSQEKSCVVETVKRIIGLRAEYKKLRLKYVEEGRTEEPEYQKIKSDEITVKELSNSIYGIMGMQYGRYYDVDVAEAITLTGRWILNYAKAYFELRRGLKVIYGDTDSIFIQAEGELNLDEELAGFHQNIERELTQNFRCPESHICLNFDKHYTNFIIFAKKNYAGHCDNMEGKVVDKLFVRGMEYIKRNTFKWAAERQEKLLNDILRGQLPVAEVLDRVRAYKAEFFRSEFDVAQLKLSQRVGKDEYTNNALVGRLARRHEELTGINPVGTELEYIITGCKRGIRACLLVDYTGRFSREHYWEGLSRPLFDKILEVVAPGKNIDQDLLF